MMRGISPLVSAALALNLTGVLSPFLETPSRKAREGNARYAAGDWEGAAERYAEAAAAAKDGAYAYNLGTANYRKKDFPAAIDALSRAATDAKLDLGRVVYNIGNAKFRSGDLEGALGAYRAALSAHPEDEDARSNYELALRELQQQNQNQRQNQNEESNKDNQQNQDQKNQENQEGESDQDSRQNETDQSGEKKEGEEKKDRQDAQDEAQEPQSADSSAVRRPEPGQMSPQEAARLLNAVTPKERELLQARLKPTRKHKAEKDW